MRRGLPTFSMQRVQREGNRANAKDPDIERWENEGGSTRQRVKQQGLSKQMRA